MQRTQALALIGVALVLGFIIGFKSGQKGAPAPAPEPLVAEASATPAAGQPALPRLVDLGSTTCIPCKEMEPILAELTAEYAGIVSVEFINVNENYQAAEEYKINVIPTQVFLDAEGQEVYRHEGFMPKADIVAQFEKMGIKKE
jgi:thioredoxin 1